MRKYIIKNADGSEQTVMRTVYESREEAGASMMNYIRYHNENCDGDKYLSPFDFILEEVYVKDVNETVTNFESAREAISNNTNFTIIFKDVTTLVSEVNSTHMEALIALNRLFTIAQAWNKEDGFIPDFSDWEQDKWFPWFKYDKDVAEFVCADTINAATAASAHLGSRLCFKTSDRAEQFGKQFADLYNKVFL